MTTETDGEGGGQDWEKTARDLQDHGIPETRAKVVALIDAGRTHAEVQEELSLSSAGQVSNHVKRYREDDLGEAEERKRNAEWLINEGPEI